MAYTIGAPGMPQFPGTASTGSGGLVGGLAIGTQAPISNPMTNAWSGFGSAFGQSAIGSLADFGLGWLGSVISNKQQRNMMDYQNEIWRSNYDMMREDALEDYARQRQDYLSDLASEREWNSASSVKQRLLEAGINPNSMSGQFGTASSAAQNQASIRSSEGYGPSATAAAMRAGGLANNIAPLMTSSLTQLRARQLEADLDKTRSDTIKSMYEGTGQHLRNIAQEIENRYKAEEKEMYITEMMEHANLYIAQAAATWYQKNNLGPAKIAEINSAIELAEEKAKYIVKMAGYYSKLGQKIDIEKTLLEFQRDVLNPLEEKIKKTEAGVTVANTVIDGIHTTADIALQALSLKQGKGGVVVRSGGGAAPSVPSGASGTNFKSFTTDEYDFANMPINML